LTLFEPILYGVAAVDGAFFVRAGTTLFRIGRTHPAKARVAPKGRGRVRRFPTTEHFTRGSRPCRAAS